MGLFGVFASIKIGASESSSLSPIIFPFLYLFTLYSLTKVRFSKKDSFIQALCIFLFSGLLITALLSYNPIASSLSVIYLFFNFIFGIWLAKTHTKDEFLIRTLEALTFTLLISIILLFVRPDLVIYVDPLDRDSIIGLPNFKGLFPHKIHAGIYCIIGFILSRYFYLKVKTRKYLFLATFFVIGVLGSGSSLAFATLLLVSVITPTIKFIKLSFGLQGLFLLTFVTILIIVFGIYFGLSKYILESLGRDATLTGRTSIWEFGIGYIKSHPFIGGGFNVFFSESTDSPAQELWARSAFYKAPSFHNGYIEIIAEAGIIGSFSFLYILFNTFKKAIKQNDTLSIAIFIICLIANMAAAILVKQNSFFFVFLIYNCLDFKGLARSRINKAIYSSNKEQPYPHLVKLL